VGTISDRRASNGDFPAANRSGKSSDSAWFPRVVAIDPFCELLFSDAPCPQRTLHFDGSPTTLLEPSLHAELGVDAVYAARSSYRPRVDCKEDARYISPWLALPGYRYTVGMARSWHFLSVYGFLLNGFIFIALLFFTDQWKRLVPTSWEIVPAAWNAFVYYATLHMPAEPNGFYQFNSLQKLSYLAVIFVMPPLSMLTGIAMSPAVDNRFPFFPKLFGSRQGARSIHFILLIGYLCFLAVHVGLVAVTGFVRNMNHIVTGRDDAYLIGMILGLIGIGLVVVSWGLFHFIAWKYPRTMQHLY
jgi:sulfoxide reductase catalytic subunit YedY